MSDFKQGRDYPLQTHTRKLNCLHPNSKDHFLVIDEFRMPKVKQLVEVKP